MQENGYLTAGDFFEKLDDVEVLLLGVMMDSVKTDDFQTYKVDTELAEKYFNLAKENKTALVASRKCYVIAAENAMSIAGLYNDDQNETK